MPNLRGRKALDQAADQERSGRDCDTESDDEFDLGSAEEAERGVVKKTVHERNWSSKAWEPALHTHARQGRIRYMRGSKRLDSVDAN